MATIITKNSSTASSVPLNTQLVQGELAVNVTDKRLFTENASGTVVELGTNPSTLVTSNTFLAFGRGNTEDMRLTSTGLGIGTSSPNEKLVVNGAVRSSSNAVSVTASAGAVMDYFSGMARFFATDGSAVGQMNLDKAGNLGLGVAPSAWSAGKAIEVGFLGHALWSPASNETIVSNAAYFNSVWRYADTGNSPSQYSQLAGAHRWFTAPSGTAGNAISFTQAMTLDASGNLGLNTPSPVALNSGGGYFTVNNASSGGGVVFQNNAANIAYTIADTDGLRFDTFTGKILKFGIQGSERARIDSSGNLLVGTTDSGRTTGIGIKLDIAGYATTPTVSCVGSASTNSADTYHVYSTGASAYRFYVGYGGTIYATSTTITGISDQRLKENIRDLDEGLNTVMALKPRKFDWKEGKGKDIKNDRGWIAQEFETVLPDMVEEWRDPAPEGEEPYKAVNANLIPVLVKAIQEQQAIINAQSAALEQLKAQLTSVSADVAALKGAA